MKDNEYDDNNDYDNNDKRASPLIEYTFNEIIANITSWRDTLREELESLIYIKNCMPISEDNSNMNNPNTSQSQEQRIKGLIPKLEALCLKEIDCINEFMSSTMDRQYEENSERLYSKVESIRDNYNKIIVNIKKMISSVPLLGELKLKYLNSVIPKDKDIKTISQRDGSEQKIMIDMRPKTKCKSNEASIKKMNTVGGGEKLNRTSNKGNKEQLIEGINKDLNEINKGKLAQTHSEKESRSIKAFYRQEEENKSEFISRNNSFSKQKQMMINRPITPILTNTNQNSNNKKQLNTTSNSNSKLTRTNNNNNNPQSQPNKPSSIKQNIIEREAINVLAEEIKHLKSYYEELNQTVKNHCLISNQRKDFEQMKKENIKLIADVSILKEDMLELMKSYQKIDSTVNALQVENDNLRQHNKNLLAYIANSNPNYNLNANDIDILRQLESDTNSNSNTGSNQKNNNMCFNSNDLVFSNSIQQGRSNDRNLNNNKASEVLSDLSAFNCNAMMNCNRGRNNSQNNELMNMMNATNLSELTRLNQTITNNSKNATPNSIKQQRRFLINKD